VEVHRDQGRQRKNDTHLLLEQSAFVFCVVSGCFVDFMSFYLNVQGKGCQSRCSVR